MGALILPSRFTQQPQQAARLDSGNPLALGANAVINASVDVNAVTGIPLVWGASGYAKGAQPAGRTLSFRKNFYAQTEFLPAPGTNTFVEFWCGSPLDTGSQGSTTVPSFVTGSSANQTGIFTYRGSGFDTSGGQQNHWGAVYNWDAGPILNTAADQLFFNEYVVLVVVRRQDRMEFWKNGRLVNTISQTPVSYPSQTLLVGSFIPAPFWTTASDTSMAGRILADWSPAQIRSFSSNPWQLFKAPARRYWVNSTSATTVVSPGAGVIAFTGYAPTVARTAAQSVAPATGTLTFTGYAPTVSQTAASAVSPGTGTLTFTGYAPSVTQAVNIAVLPGAGSLAFTGYAPTVVRTALAVVQPASGTLTFTGYAPTVTRTASASVSPATGALQFTGYAPTIFQGLLGATPQLNLYTIMSFPSVNLTANLGAPINLTANLL